MALTTVIKNGKTTYTINFYYKDNFGNRKRVKKESFTTRKEAKVFKETFLQTYSGNCSGLFKNLANDYLKHCEAHLKITSYLNLKATFEKHFTPYFGEMPVCKITPAIISCWQDSLIKAGLSANSLRTFNTRLSVFFNRCVKIHNLKQNPVKICGTMGKVVTRLNFWTLEEFNKFIVSVDNPALKLAYNILFFGGLRLGELLALYIEDFDSVKCTLNVNKTYHDTVPKDYSHIGTPKTPTSNRIVTMPPKICTMLSEYIKTMYQPKPKERIFFCLTPYKIKITLKNNSNRLGLPVIHIHDLRHSHASLLIQQGVSPLLLSQRLGHKNVSTTLNIYSHLYPNAAEKIAKSLDSLIS